MSSARQFVRNALNFPILRYDWRDKKWEGVAMIPFNRVHTLCSSFLADFALRVSGEVKSSSSFMCASSRVPRLLMRWDLSTIQGRMKCVPQKCKYFNWDKGKLHGESWRNGGPLSGEEETYWGNSYTKAQKEGKPHKVCFRNQQFCLSGAQGISKGI